MRTPSPGYSARQLFLLTVAILGLFAAVWPRRALADITTGNIEGTVTDYTGKGVIGVTVTVASPALQGEQTEFTDSNGHYIITQLPPGEYVVHFYYGDITIDRPGVLLLADKTLRVSIALPSPNKPELRDITYTLLAKTKTYFVKERAPAVDIANTQIQTEVTSELINNAPINGVNGRRTFESVLTLAPGSGTDLTGTTFNGASGAENNYLIDGLNTTSGNYGVLSSQLSLEFIGQTEIITGGYNAEYGRAMGGVVSAVTKTGSNTLHGGLWFFGTPPGASPSSVSRYGEAITYSNQLKRAFDFGFDLGGPILKDKIWFYVGFAPTNSTVTTTRSIRTRLANNLDPGQMMGTYAGDLSGSTRCPSYLISEACNQGKDFAYADLPGYTKTYNTNRWLYNWIAKLNFQLNANNSLSIEYIGSPQTTEGVQDVPNWIVPDGFVNGSEAQMLSKMVNQNHDIIAHFISKLFRQKLQLELIAGYHLEQEKIEPASSAGYTGAIQDTRSSPLTQFENVAPCTPQTIHGVQFSPCPVTNYYDGGYGFYRDWTSHRISVHGAGTYFFSLGGTHALKVGADVEHNIFHDHREFPSGGNYEVFPGGNIQRTAYVTKAPDGMNFMLLPNGLSPTTTTTNEALYLRDSWNIKYLPGLVINGGVRFEFEQVRDINGKTQIDLKDNIAPRVGLVYDWTRQGRSKIYASFGRFYESIPLDINNRDFSGEGFNVQSGPATGYGCKSTNGRIIASTCQFADGNTGFNSGGTFSSVSPSLKGQYSNEFVGGVQYEIGYDIVLGASYIHRDLGRVIEDMSPDGATGDFIIANPGEPTDPGVVQNLQQQISKESDPMKKAQLQKTLSLYQGVASAPKPTRDYNALVLTVNKRFANHFILMGSYTYSRSIGNYPGLYQPTNVQLDPNITTQFDLRELLVNRQGPLPDDRPHNLKLTGGYNIPIKRESLMVGLNFNLLSGRPIEVLGAHPFYGPNQSFILPAGSGGRTPFVTSFDLRLAYGHQFSRARAEIYADVFNLFNQHAVTNVDDLYSFDVVLPIQNGKPSDLKNLKNYQGGLAALNPNYGQPTSFQAPLSARFGARLSF